MGFALDYILGFAVLLGPSGNSVRPEESIPKWSKIVGDGPVWLEMSWESVHLQPSAISYRLQTLPDPKSLRINFKIDTVKAVTAIYSVSNILFWTVVATSQSCFSEAPALAKHWVSTMCRAGVATLLFFQSLAITYIGMSAFYINTGTRDIRFQRCLLGTWLFFTMSKIRMPGFHDIVGISHFMKSTLPEGSDFMQSCFQRFRLHEIQSSEHWGFMSSEPRVNQLCALIDQMMIPRIFKCSI